MFKLLKTDKEHGNTIFNDLHFNKNINIITDEGTLLCDISINTEFDELKIHLWNNKMNLINYRWKSINIGG